mgnify:CR=1 FL=1
MNILIENIISKFFKIMINFITKNDQPTYPNGRDPWSLINRLVPFNLYIIILILYIIIFCQDIY